MTTIASLLSSLYKRDSASPFPLHPVLEFRHGEALEVAEFVPNAPTGYTCKVYETRLPASSYEARLTAPGEPAHVLTTGTSEKAGHVLRQLCAAFQCGQAGFACDDDDRLGPPVTAPRVHQDGRQVFVHLTRREGYELELPEHFGFMEMKAAQSLFVKDKALAMSVASLIAGGMLNIDGWV
jgi:hypothetical protein